MTATAGRDFTAAFNAVTAPVIAPPRSPRRVTQTEAVAEFIDACDSALVLAGIAPDTSLLRDIDIEDEGAMLKAFFLFLANTGTLAAELSDGSTVEAWRETVSADVWRLLGFREGPPPRLMLRLAFEAMANSDHQAGALAPLVWLVGDLALSGLLSALRS